MNTNLVLIMMWIVIWCFVWYLVAKVYFLIKIKGQRQNAVDRSRSVVLGHVNEKIAPLLPNFPYHYKDLVFLGKGIDYLVFDGLSQGELKKIVFLEIKSWVSTLNRNERLNKECIGRGNISYEIRRN